MGRLQVTLIDKVRFLADPASYAERPRRVEVIETHFAWVFLTPRYAYKLKKPLRRVGMDYRSLAQRARGCRAELQLNRRLAPTVYLSVQPLSLDRHGSLRWGRAGRVEEFVVKMRRIRRARMLDHALRRGALALADRKRVLRRLVDFYRRAQRPPVGAAADLRRLGLQLRRQRAVLRAFGRRIDQTLVEAAFDALLSFMRSEAAMLGARGRCVIEAHGDLRAEHVCLESQVSIIDCLEFSRALRLRDPADDLSTLALDCDRVARRPLGMGLLRLYRTLSGDPISDALLCFYLGLNAATRAMLAALHVDDPQYPVAAPWLRGATVCLREAVRYGREAARASATAARPAPARAVPRRSRRAADA